MSLPLITRVISQDYETDPPVFSYGRRTEEQVMKNEAADIVGNLTEEQVIELAVEDIMDGHMVSGPTDIIKKIDKLTAG